MNRAFNLTLLDTHMYVYGLKKSQILLVILSFEMMFNKSLKYQDLVKSN